MWIICSLRVWAGENLGLSRGLWNTGCWGGLWVGERLFKLSTKYCCSLLKRIFRVRLRGFSDALVIRWLVHLYYSERFKLLFAVFSFCTKVLEYLSLWIRRSWYACQS